MIDAQNRGGGAAAIRAVALTKRYRNVLAVDALQLDIARGEFYGLLGPNGAGKTTAVHMLSTLIRPTSGEAWVADHPVAAEPLRVRAAIGVVFQESALDRTLTVAENLRFAGMLNDMPGALIRSRSAELLELFGLSAARDREAASLSGGMRRALDIARGLMHRPDVLFLDEPTTGLDVTNRQAIWRHIAALRAELRITVVLTTHYLEEATACDRVGFMDAGRLVREGVPSRLIDELGEYVVEIDAVHPESLARTIEARMGRASIEGNVVSFCFDGDAALLSELNAELGPSARAMRWRRPTLNDVFVRIVRERDRAQRIAPRSRGARVEELQR